MSWPPPNYDPNRGAGYQVTFDEFRQLVSYPPYQIVIAPLLRAWFEYQIIGQHGDAMVSTADGDSVNLQELHDRIQSDPRRQYELYQNAMDLWR